MKISELFKKSISRPINGVVKADQMDDSSVWQELDEFVITKELDQHFRKFFGRYCEAIDAPRNTALAANTGVWVSGFFGSGKSHFIKVLSYLLANDEHTLEGEKKPAVDFFTDKVSDATTWGNIKKAVASKTDVILFNIDSKAGSRDGKSAVLSVFLKVLNEKLGYSPHHAHIANMERYLDGKGKLGEFQKRYRELTQTEWIDERDAYEFNRDEVVQALSETLGQSEQSCEKWVDNSEDNFDPSVENFAKWTKAYLDKKGKNHRLIFLVDEVGQFIGKDTNLMLNLQTIAEQLGTVCEGRAWLVVTSQEDIDSVLGDIPKIKENDFSKIQGRFSTRLSLSSSNVDEVIQQRLLLKKDDDRSVADALSSLFDEKGDILKNQLSFHDLVGSFPELQGKDDFARVYPFAPYQFRLLQRIFESIRKAGATGLHLAQGERSLLDAFQYAGKTVADQEVGILVPLYMFFPSIGSFLDSIVQRTFEYAEKNKNLEPFDIEILRVLFLIRYVDEMKGNIENLVTLCLDQVDADRFALKKKIQESLDRLDKESLVNRNSDLYYFLTNEERDINQEIKKVSVGSIDEAKSLGRFIFQDVCQDRKKYRYEKTKKDIPFNRLCDGQPYEKTIDGEMILEIASPLSESYSPSDDSRYILASATNEGKVVIRLKDDTQLRRELLAWMRTYKYLNGKDKQNIPTTTARIMRDLAEENEQRRIYIIRLLRDMLAEADYFVCGQKLEIRSNNAAGAMDEAMEYLVKNSFTKMEYLRHLQPDTNKILREIKAILSSDDTTQQELRLELEENNPQALKELRDYIELATIQHKELVVYNLCFERFSNRPYGWPEWETALLLVRLYAASELYFVHAGDAIKRDDLYAKISETKNWRGMTVVQKKTAAPEEVRKARELGKEVFHEMGPETEDALFMFLRKHLETWKAELQRFSELAEEGRYPGKEAIANCLSTVKNLLSVEESNQFMERFNQQKSDLQDLSEDYHDLLQFYTHQKKAWDNMLRADRDFSLNRSELDKDETAAKLLRRLDEIRKMPAPYSAIREIEPALATLQKLNEDLIVAQRNESLQKIDTRIDEIQTTCETHKIETVQRDAILSSLRKLRERTVTQKSVAHIRQNETESVEMKDTALNKIAELLKPKAEETKPVYKPPRIVKPKDFLQAEYLESRDDVEKFLKKLRAELESALENNEKIEIR